MAITGWKSLGSVETNAGGGGGGPHVFDVELKPPIPINQEDTFKSAGGRPLFDKVGYDTDDVQMPFLPPNPPFIFFP